MDVLIINTINSTKKEKKYDNEGTPIFKSDH